MRAPCFILLGILATSCAPTQFLKKNYPPGQLEGKALILYPLFSAQVTVINTEDFQDDFEGEAMQPNEFWKGELNNLAGQYFGKEFQKVILENADDSIFSPLNPENSTKISEKIGKEEFEIRIPKAEYLQSLKLKPRFILVMDQVIFSRNMATYQHNVPSSAPATVNVGGQLMKNPGYAPMGATVTTSKKYIATGINYVIWDYEESAIVGYGFAKGEKSFQFAMTKSDWYKSVDNAFGSIKKFSPF